MNLLMLSGDTSLAEGRDSTFARMISRFATHWERIDVICPRALGATPRQFVSNVFVHPSTHHKLRQPQFIVGMGRRLFAERPYALVTSHDYGLFLNGIGAWQLTRGTQIPYVSELHHMEGYPRAVNWREWLYRMAAFQYIRWVQHHAAAIRVVNSVEMPQLLHRLGVPPEKILILPSQTIDSNLFHPDPGVSRRFDVLFVGRLVANKGIFTILDAIAQVKTRHPAVKLGMLGHGPLQKAIEKRITARNLQENITLIPRLESASDVAMLYQQSAMLVCASTSEGGPRVTVEAMACGVPVISTPVGAMPDVVQNGENGLLFNWSVTELAQKITLLLDQPAMRQQLAERGQQSVQSYRLDQVVDRYALGYHDLIGRLKGSTPCD